MTTTTPIITEAGYGGSEPSITAEIRAKIIELIRSGRGCNETAREVGVSAGTISRIARDVGHDFGEAAERTAVAVTARRSQLAKRRADLAEQAHTVSEEAGAYALFQLRNRPDDPRGIEQALRAHRDALAGYRDLILIDGPPPDAQLEETLSWFDRQMIGIRRYAQPPAELEAASTVELVEETPGLLG